MESKSSSKRLLFDRRYGWVIDEWKDPSEEALAGGRGMFCIVPLTKAVFSFVSRTINGATESAIKALETPDMLSRQSLQANIRESFDNLMGLMHNPNFAVGLSPMNSSLSGNSSSQLPMEENRKISKFACKC